MEEELMIGLSIDINFKRTRIAQDDLECATVTLSCPAEFGVGKRLIAKILNSQPLNKAITGEDVNLSIEKLFTADGDYVVEIRIAPQNGTFAGLRNKSCKIIQKFYDFLHNMKAK